MAKHLFLCSLALLVAGAECLRCYEGSVVGLSNNSQTAKKDCSGISNYCIQRINKQTGEMRRECSSWSDEHSMEEKCPVSGCHYITKDESFCCCQFDECNEWKGDGTEFKAGETVLNKPQISTDAGFANEKKSLNVEIPTTQATRAHRIDSADVHISD